MKENNISKASSLIWTAVIYLLGLFIGAIDSGIISPARPIIQHQLGVDANLGIWMITIYTLAYAAIIPISGKLADKHGRKPVYILSIFLFGLGSLVCAMSAFAGSFLMLMIGRIVQACGAGGIMPVATAEFGTSFPEEKRGMALGLVGAVYGIANVLGASLGSLILNIAGQTEWQWIFLINVPICIFIVAAGIKILPDHRFEGAKAMDRLGTLLMTLIILSLLYGLKNLDFFDFAASFSSKDVWPFILISLVLMPIFVLVEKREEDPIFHIEYFSNRQVMIILALGIFVGCSMMGMIFIPQFAENCLKMKTGSGGYFVIILGLCSGVSSMTSGKMIDKHGAKPVMAAGFLTTIAGCLYLSFVAVRFVCIANVIISLIIIGYGLGLTMGTPLNYMMLQNTSDEESTSALATLSLVRSIGTAVAPAIMVGFIVHASAGLEANLMEIFPKEMPRAAMTTEQQLPEEVLDELQNGDVTTITGTMVKLVESMSGGMPHEMVEKMIGDMSDEIEDTYQRTLNTGYRDMYIFLAAVNFAGLLLLILYREPKKNPEA